MAYTFRRATEPMISERNRKLKEEEKKIKFRVSIIFFRVVIGGCTVRRNLGDVPGKTFRSDPNPTRTLNRR